MDRFYALAARAFAEARPGDIILYEDAYRNIALAISQGNAAQTFGIHPGMEVRLRVA
jgi:S-adenosylmethionine hydrolase